MISCIDITHTCETCRHSGCTENEHPCCCCRQAGVKDGEDMWQIDADYGTDDIKNVNCPLNLTSIFDEDDVAPMTSAEYQEQAMRTNDDLASLRLVEKIAWAGHEQYDVGGIIMASLGLSGEVGELNDLIKKWIYHEQDMDVEHTKKELGDILWYVTCMAESFGWQLDDIMQLNISKLWARYPDGFDPARSIHRSEGDI